MKGTPIMRISSSLFMAVALFLLVSCGSNQPGSDNSDLSNTPILPDSTSPTPRTTIQPVLPAQQEVTETYPTLLTPYDPVIQNLIDLAKADLAGRLAIETTGINILEVSQVTWPDAGLGCQPSGSYSAQVLTPGYRIMLAYGNEVFEYHTNNTTYIIYCKIPNLPVSGNPNQ
jgi:hypothetical protein